MTKYKKVVWKRYLYLEQPFADNHVDDSFLEGLRRNGNRQTSSNK